MSFYNKYLKYKNKYLELKKQYGGNFNQYGGNFKCPRCIGIGNGDYKCKNCTQDAKRERNGNVLDLLNLHGTVGLLDRNAARAVLATPATEAGLAEQIKAHKWPIVGNIGNPIVVEYPQAIAVKHKTKDFVLVNATINIKNYDFNGNAINLATKPVQVCGGVAISPDDKYMVLSEQIDCKIYVLNIETKEVVHEFGSKGEVNDQFSAPTSVAISNAEGGGYYVLVADSGNYRIVILKMTNEGKLSWDSTINNGTVGLPRDIKPRSICITPNGICFFVDALNKCIVKFNIGQSNFAIFNASNFANLPEFDPKYVAVSNDGNYLCVACTINFIVLFVINNDILTVYTKSDEIFDKSLRNLQITQLAMSPNADAVIVIVNVDRNKDRLLIIK